MNDEVTGDQTNVGGAMTPPAGLAVAEETRKVISPTAMYATLAFKYEETSVVHGQLFQMRGRPNDAALVGVGHFKEVKEAYPAGAYEHPCLRCSRIFVDEYFQTMHEERCPAQEIRVEPGTIDITKNPEAAAALKDALGG